MRRRNTPADAKPDSYDSVAAFYTNLTFSANITVTNLTETWKERRSFTSLQKVHPKARGWLEAYLPGYSAEGSHAVVRAGVGPSAHGAMLTAVLEKRDDKWAVAWYYLAHFAQIEDGDMSGWRQRLVLVTETPRPAGARH